jgi:5-methylcytosine-specific restriction endonuclease McrA
MSRGELHLTAMKLLAPVLTNDNTELLKLACHKSKQEIQLLIAKHCPQPDAPALLRRLPAVRGMIANGPQRLNGSNSGTANAIRRGTNAVGPAAAATLITASRAPLSASATLSESGASPSRSATISTPPAVTAQAQAVTPTLFDLGSAPEESVAPAVTPQVGQTIAAEPSSSSDTSRVAPAARTAIFQAGPSMLNRESVTPIREGRYKIQFTAGQHFRDLVQEAQDLYRNQLPGGDVDVLLERALELLVAARKKELYAQTEKPRRREVASVKSHHAPESRTRHIPNEVKRHVFARDEGRCRFVGRNGQRCRARGRLEFHHVHAFGLGGHATESNIVLFCRAHNRLMAERDFTREHIERCIRTRKSEVRSRTGYREYNSTCSGAAGPGSKEGNGFWDDGAISGEAETTRTDDRRSDTSVCGEQRV